MYSGWIIKWKLNRPLRPEEKVAALPRQPLSGTMVDERGTLTAFNSTYAEFVGRRFRLRGGTGTALPLIVSVILIAFLFYILFIPSPSNVNMAPLDLTASICILILIALFWFYIFRRDFCTSIYYPIRFNRKTRMVYVFRDPRDGGILTMPWEQGFFHVGKGLRDKRLLDLRCHILDGETVKDTFVTGIYYGQKERVEQVWEFVRRYMDEDIASLGEVVIWNSAKPTFRNCMLIAGTNVGAITRALTVVLFPITVLMAGMRWLVLKTCKPPVWPPEIEAACRIDPDDPHRLPEPEYIGQFLKEWQEAHPNWDDMASL